MMHETGELTCPRCGELLEGDFGTVEVSTSGKMSDDPEGMMFRTEIECPHCGAPLAAVVESALPEALGVNVWVEDRKEESDQ